MNVGLDVGARHVRAVAVRGTRVVACAVAARLDGDGVERPLPTVIAELGAAMPLARPAACASSEVEVLARFLHVPPLPPERLARLLRLELAGEEGQAAIAADAVRLAVGGEELAFLGLVADPVAVRSLQAELKRAGVRPRTLSWGPLGLATAAARLPLDGEELALVADIGAGGTDVALVGAGRLLACRRLGVGGELFTQAMIEGGMTPAAAERHKLDGEFAREAAAAPVIAPGPVEDPAALLFDLGEAPPGVASPGQTTTQLATLSLGPQLTRAAETLYGQLATTLAFFKAQLKCKELTLSRVYLCGGGAGLVSLDEYLRRRFQIPVERWDPFAGLAGDIPPEPHRWARALGLALAGGGDAAGADLRPEGDLLRERWLRRLVWPWVAAGCLLVAGAAIYLGLSAIAERDQAETEMLERATAEYKTLSEKLAGLEAQRDALGADLRAIAGRIHAARDLLYTVRALKEQTQKSKELWATSLETRNVGRPETTPALPGRSLLGGSKPAHDTLIDRGGVVIYARVRCDVKQTKSDRVSYKNKYQQALEDWTTPEGWRLFRKIELKEAISESYAQAVDGEGGDFTFALSCAFQPTHLDGESADPEKAVPAKPLETAAPPKAAP